MKLQTHSRESWLLERAKHVSSTESAALFGMSPYMTAYELGIQKMNADPGEIEPSERIRWGKRLEDAIAQGIADDYRVMIEAMDYSYAVHPTEPRMGASFDYSIVGVTDKELSGLGMLYEQHGPGLLEIKNVDSLVYKNWPEHDAPDHIEIQVQHQMEVARVEWCVLGVLVGGNRTEVYTRMRGGQVGAAIVKKVHEFWHNLESGLLPPAVMPEDADLIIKLHQYAEPSKVFDGQDDAVLADLCAEYQVHSFNASQAEKAQKAIKARILTHIGDAERALVSGYNISASMVAPALVKEYTRNGYRNFRLTKKESKS